MDFYLIDPIGPQLHLPVNPGEVTIRRDKQYETVNIINLGEVDFPHGERLKEISFSSFFPRDYDPSYCNYPDLPDPQMSMNQLTTWTVSKKPIRLIITETEVNVLVLVTAHISYFRGGEPGDVYFDLTCRTWREVKVRKAAEAAATTAISAVEQQRPRPDLKPVPKVYVVKPGDSLWKIAKKELTSGDKWKLIYDLNKSTIGSNPDLILPGQKLVMPV